MQHAWPRLRAALDDPPLVDIALAGLLMVLSVQATLRLWVGEPAVLGTAALLVGVAQAGALVWRRSRAITVLVVVMGAEMVAALAHLDIYDYTWPVAIYSVCVYRPLRVAVTAVAGVLLLVPLGAALRSSVTGLPYAVHLVDWAGLVLPLLLPAAAFGLAVGADRARSLRRRAAAVRAERIEAIERHRARIAGDLNALVAVDAKRTAELVDALRPELLDLADRLADVRTHARTALRTVRLLLEQLRADPPAETVETLPTGRRRRWLPTAGGALVAAGVAGVLVLVARFPGLARLPRPATTALTVAGQHGTTILVLLAVQVAAFAWWRSAPAGALLVNTAALVCAQALGADNHVAATAPALLYYATAVGTPIPVSAAVVALAVAAQVGANAVAGATTGLVSIALVVAVWLIGVLRRRASHETRQTEAIQASVDRRAALGQERRRITRELHDLVGHHLSACALQAGVAHRAAMNGRLEPDALTSLADSIHAAVHGLPTVLVDTLGHPGSTAFDRLTATDIDRLVAPLRAGGLPVTVSVTARGHDPRPGAGHPSGDEADLFARRILQEALTNIVRHGGSAPTVIDIHDSPAAVTVSVVSEPAPSPVVASPGSGQGLQSMRERVDLLGGELDVGPRGDGGWRVRARLPRPGGPSAASPRALSGTRASDIDRDLTTGPVESSAYLPSPPRPP